MSRFNGRPRLGPGEVAYLLRHARSLLDRLETDHRYCHEAAYGLQAPTGLRSGAGGHSDPTAAPWTALRGKKGEERESARAECARLTLEAAGQLKQAVACLVLADETIGRACHAVDNPGPKDHTPAPFHDTIPAGRPDLSAAHAAKARRGLRGDL